MVPIADSYILMFATTIVFTAFAITRKTIFLFLLSGFCWIALGLSTMPLTTGVLQIPMFILFMGIGIIFLLGSFQIALGMLAQKRQREEEEQWGVSV